ncbi:hypothetical protein [Tamlana sp. I1]|uniref:hypothetical protein n=1 Tax=Tamlana sp. I1 TaxID=2762061 RepID=UPI00188DCFE8|nr:hypothetical protein [Tamlana sp. I1]
MKNKIILLLCCAVFSCGNKKVVELPEIDYSEISKINDVSPGYLFYDETQKDSVELNRKNLIVSTNWLINVDKRLTLNQVIPHIKFLQEKKNNSSHKNENARNYYTCNNTSEKQLGFIEFTEVVYTEKTDASPDLEASNKTKFINFNQDGSIYILNPNAEPFVTKSTKNTLLNDLKKVDSTGFILVLRFHKNLSFQEYISYKSLIAKAELKQAKISKEEFLDN